MTLRLALLVATLGLLTGCAPYVIAWSPDDAPKTLQVDIARHDYTVRFPSGSSAIGPAERARLARFVAGGGILPPDRVYLAAADTESRLARRRMNNLMAALHTDGVGVDTAVSAVPAAGAGRDRTVLQIEHAVVTPPDCPNWSKPPIDYSGQVSSNFGCATTTNLALMVADPTDLLRANKPAPADPGAPVGAIDGYRGAQGWGAPRTPTPFSTDFNSGADATPGGQ